jgi:hypothetical protein
MHKHEEHLGESLPEVLLLGLACVVKPNLLPGTIRKLVERLAVVKPPAPVSIVLPKDHHVNA